MGSNYPNLLSHILASYCRGVVIERLRYKVEQQGYKACMGILKLADKYTPERLENACKKALTFTPRPSYKNIQVILSTGQDKTKKSQQAEASSSDAYGFTRGADYYGGED